jgi:hypothetical protein
MGDPFQDLGMIDFSSIRMSGIYQTSVAQPDASPDPSSNSLTKNKLHPDNSENSKNVSAKTKSATPTGTQDLSAEELRELAELKQRDQEVKAHEQAHIAAGGAYARGSAQYEYEKGPDGRKYAVGGEVQIDTSKVPGDPEATIRKMQIVRSAALAPSNPSPQDRRVAAKATQVENQMRQEILAEHYKNAASHQSDPNENSDSPSTAPQSSSISLGGLIDLVS